MADRKLEDTIVTVTMPFKDWDRLKSALFIYGPKVDDIDKKIGSAMADAYNEWRRANG